MTELPSPVKYGRINVCEMQTIIPQSRKLSSRYTHKENARLLIFEGKIETRSRCKGPYLTDNKNMNKIMAASFDNPKLVHCDGQL